MMNDSGSFFGSGRSLRENHLKIYHRWLRTWLKSFSKSGCEVASRGRAARSRFCAEVEWLEKRELLSVASSANVVVPSIVAAGKPITPQVLLEDGGAQVDPTENTAVSLTVMEIGPDSKVIETLNAVAVNGVATFSNVDLTVAGNYSFQAVDAADGLSGSGATTVVAGPAAKLVSGAPPQNIVLESGESVGFFVDLEDQYGNAVDGDGSTATLQLLNGPADGTVTGPTSNTVLAGVSNEFWPEQFTGRGVFEFQITDGSLTPLAETVTVAPRPTVLHSFIGDGSPLDVSGPSSLIFDSDGNAYGVTDLGGANGTGTLFEITHDTHQFVTLASIDSGWGGVSAPVMDGAGNIYVASTQKIAEFPRGECVQDHP